MTVIVSYGYNDKAEAALVWLRHVAAAGQLNCPEWGSDAKVTLHAKPLHDKGFRNVCIVLTVIKVTSQDAKMIYIYFPMTWRCKQDDLGDHFGHPQSPAFDWLSCECWAADLTPAMINWTKRSDESSRAGHRTSISKPRIQLVLRPPPHLTTYLSRL